MKLHSHLRRSPSSRFLSLLCLLYFLKFLCLFHLRDLHSRRSRAPAHPPRLEADAVAHRRPQGRRCPPRHEAHHAPGPHAQAGHPPPCLASPEYPRSPPQLALMPQNNSLQIGVLYATSDVSPADSRSCPALATF